MGVEVAVEGLSKSFGRQAIWRDVTLTLPAGEVSVLLGPSGTGKSVFLKCLIGLLRPERGSVVIDGVDLCVCPEKDMYEIRKLFGVLFQDGALFGSMSIFDNVAFPLREHTRKSETEIRRIVMSKMDMVGMLGAEHKLPGEISGGMRKRAGLARALVLDPQIILCDEPDSGLDPVRTAYLSQLLIDLNAQIDATILIVTHNINVARTVPDNLGMLFRKELVMFGPREVLLTSDEPVVAQFLNGRRIGPIGMSEEKDSATMAAELANQAAGHGDGSGDDDLRGIVPQLEPTPGLPTRQAVRRRRARVLQVLDTLPEGARQGILAELSLEDFERYQDWRRRTSGMAMPEQLPNPLAQPMARRPLPPSSTQTRPPHPTPRPNQPGPTQTGPTQPRPSQPGQTQPRPGQTGPIQHGTGGPPLPPARKPRPWRRDDQGRRG